MKINFHWKSCEGHSTAWNIFRSHIVHQTVRKNLNIIFIPMDATCQKLVGRDPKFVSHTDRYVLLQIVSRKEFWTNLSPVIYGDLVYKLRRVKCEANFVSLEAKLVKHLRRRKYDPAIIERTIGHVFCSSTALYISFLKHFTLTNKALGIIWRDLSKPPQRRQNPDPRSFRL